MDINIAGARAVVPSSNEALLVCSWLLGPERCLPTFSRAYARVSPVLDKGESWLDRSPEGASALSRNLHAFQAGLGSQTKGNVHENSLLLLYANITLGWVGESCKKGTAHQARSKVLRTENTAAAEWMRASP